MTTAVGDALLPTCGQPRNATNALASTNSIAAPANRDPAVPKLAMYARVARTSSLNRLLRSKPLALLQEKSHAVATAGLDPERLDRSPPRRSSQISQADPTIISPMLSYCGT